MLSDARVDRDHDLGVELVYRVVVDGTSATWVSGGEEDFGYSTL
jgi:hypothetical protein